MTIKKMILVLLVGLPGCGPRPEIKEYIGQYVVCPPAGSVDRLKTATVEAEAGNWGGLRIVTNRDFTDQRGGCRWRTFVLCQH